MTDVEIDPNNAVSYAGRINATQGTYPGIISLNQETTTTPILSDDFDQPAGTFNHPDILIFVFLDGHTDTLRLQAAEFDDVRDPLTN